MVDKLSEVVCEGIMRKMSQLKEEVKAGVVSEVLESSKETLVQEYLPSLSESVANNLINYLSKVNKTDIPSVDEKYYHLVENLKVLMLPFIDKDKVSIMESHQAEFGSRIMELTEQVQTMSTALEEAVQEIKTAYKKLNMTQEAYNSALAQLEAYKLLENSQYKSEFKDSLLECSSVDEVRTTYNKLMSKVKASDKLASLNNLNGLKEAMSSTNGKGFKGEPIIQNEEKYRNRKLAGIVK